MARQINVVLALRDRFTGPMQRSTEQIRRMEMQQRRAQNQLNRWANSGIQGLNRMSTAILNTTALASGMVGAFAFKTGLSESMGMEGYRMQLETAMKDTKKAAEMMKWAVDFANSTPFETGPVVEATTKLQAYGLSAKKYLPLVGDMAAAMNKDMDQAVEAVADAQTGELERLKEFGITKLMIQKKSDAMFKKGTTINNKGQIIDQQKFNQTLEAIMVERFKGGMDKQAKTLKGRWSTITGIFKTGMATFFGISQSGDIVKGSAYEQLGKYIGEIADKFTKWQGDGTLIRFQKQFADTFGNITKIITRIVSFVQSNPALVKFILSLALGLMLAARAVTMAQGIIAFFAAIRTVGAGLAFLGMGPLGWIFLLVTALVLVITQWKEIKYWAGVAFDKMKEMSLNFGKWFEGTFQKIGQGIRDFFAGIADGIRNAFKAGNVAGVTSKVSLPANASGTSYFSGGLTRIHERGGEIMDLPRGTRIYPHDKSIQMARGSGKQLIININLGGVIGDEAMADRVGGIIARKVTLALSNT